MMFEATVVCPVPVNWKTKLLAKSTMSWPPVVSVRLKPMLLLVNRFVFCVGPLLEVLTKVSFVPNQCKANSKRRSVKASEFR